MKRRFVAVLMAGGLVMGLCGCGNAGMNSTPGPVENIVSEEQEETSVQNDNSLTPDSANPVRGAMPARRYLGDYSATELVDMLNSGEITMDDVELGATAGDVSHEIYEEISAYFSGEQEAGVGVALESGEPSDDGSIADIDLSSLLTTHVVEYEDHDGYQIRETCQLSPIFTEDDSDTMYALWEALGNDVESFPSEEALYGASHSMEYARDADSCNRLEYIIGTYTIENLTDGFPITSDNSRTYTGSLYAKQVPTSDDEYDANAANSFNLRSASAIVYSDGISYCAEQGAVVLARAKMRSNVWGPTCFIIALPNGATPNRPSGYRYDNIQIEFGNKAYADLGYDVFELTYFE